jgi:hypothetical protein
LFRNFTDPDTAVTELLTLTRETLDGFAENGPDISLQIPLIS